MLNRSQLEKSFKLKIYKMKYRLSFTAANAMIPEFIKLGKALYDGVPFDEIDENILGRGKRATNTRELRELKIRAKGCTQEQIEILSEGSHDQQVQITHLALCKAYAIYKDFVAEILLEKVQVFDYHVSELDYNSFISRKKVDHPELDAIAESTQKKIRQVIFRMLQQVELIDSIKNPTLQVPALDPKVEQAIVQDNPELLSCFLYDENRIQAIV